MHQLGLTSIRWGQTVARVGMSLLLSIGLIMVVWLEAVSGSSPIWSATSAAATTCPTTYDGGAFPCASTTTAPAGSPGSEGGSASLVATYSGGRIDARACGFAKSSNGVPVQLYVDGSPIPSSSGGVATVGSDGCAKFAAVDCLRTGTYHLAAILQGTAGSGPQEATGSLTVASNAACAGASLASSAGGSTGPGNAGAPGTSSGGAVSAAGEGSGALASTGALIAELCLIGTGLIAVGWVVVRISRRHRRRDWRPGTFAGRVR